MNSVTTEEQAALPFPQLWQRLQRTSVEATSVSSSIKKGGEGEEEEASTAASRDSFYPLHERAMCHLTSFEGSMEYWATLALRQRGQDVSDGKKDQQNSSHQHQAAGDNRNRKGRPLFPLNLLKRVLAYSDKHTPEECQCDMEMAKAPYYVESSKDGAESEDPFADSSGEIPPPNRPAALEFKVCSTPTGGHEIYMREQKSLCASWTTSKGCQLLLKSFPRGQPTRGSNGQFSGLGGNEAREKFARSADWNSRLIDINSAKSTRFKPWMSLRCYTRQISRACDADRIKQQMDELALARRKQSQILRQLQEEDDGSPLNDKTSGTEELGATPSHTKRRELLENLRLVESGEESETVTFPDQGSSFDSVMGPRGIVMCIDTRFPAENATTTITTHRNQYGELRKTKTGSTTGSSTGAYTLHDPPP